MKADPDAWFVGAGEVTLPYADLRNILANRKRWIAYAKVLEALKEIE